ncbi:uncharacterized protein BX663DRAFT_485030 [Cokeromyces recurvatus]|uniref:uncharacterized protein n=1 Tax=Cokeromyces recurvatus TaxID=90255 RepID=UPI00221E7D9C|nr:uncharacterized protein BX663DRAFT_485030 [Cokeromyces recurvatus]KAI7904182.1 hypothetical protein BX663DRAFT_485030 [Cokeromyces recurvatus]
MNSYHLHFIINSWKSGTLFLYILHYHQPSLVPDLQRCEHIEDLILECIIDPQPYHHYLSSILFLHSKEENEDDDDDEYVVFQYLLELISYLKTPTTEQILQRQRDIDHFKNIPLNSSASTISSSSSAPHDTPSLYHSSLEEEETYSTTTTVTSTYLSHKKITTTASSSIKYYCYGASRETILTEKLNRLHHHLVLMTPTEVVNEEDYKEFEQQLAMIQEDFDALQDELDDFEKSEDTSWRPPQYEAFQVDLCKRFRLLEKFAQDVKFTKLCRLVQQELDWVTQKMIQSVRTYDDIIELDEHMMLSLTFMDRLVYVTGTLTHLIKLEVLQQDHQRVMGWVDEVKVWFKEAERIRGWIQGHVKIFKELEPIEPFVETLEMTPTALKQLVEEHQRLETTIDLFHKEDMARLRTHVKTLTHGDFSPADTTTIEITLSTLTTLDELTRLVRLRRERLELLEERIKWETALEDAVAWLKKTEGDLEDLFKMAQWQQQQQIETVDTNDAIIIHTLLTLEHSMSEFDLTLFTKTVTSFQDLDTLSRVDLPDGIERRQVECEQRFEDLMKRMALARAIVEQRLKLTEFVNQIKNVFEEGKELSDQLMTNNKEVTLSEEKEMTSRVKELQNDILQLISNQIPCPEPNDRIDNYLSEQRQRLTALNDDLTSQLDLFCHLTQQYRQMNDYLEEGNQLCTWADQQSYQLDQLSLQIPHEDIHRLECDHEQHIQRLLHKKNKVIELLTDMRRLNDTRLTDMSLKLENSFDCLELALKRTSQELNNRRKELEDSKEKTKRFRLLRQFVVETRHRIPDLKQRCGFITGQVESQDKERLDILRAESEGMVSDYQRRQEEFDQLEETDDIQWMQLGQDLNSLNVFCGMVQQWYDRQRRLSMIDTELSDVEHLVVDMASDNEQSQEKIDTIEISLASIHHLLEETDLKTNNKEDPLEIANYSCARDRYNSLVERVSKMDELVMKLKKDVAETTAHAEIERHAKSILQLANDLKNEIKDRMFTLENGKFVSESAETIDHLYKCTVASNLESERAYQDLVKELDPSLKHLDLFADIETAVKDVQIWIDKEKHQSYLVRKIYIHAKAAKDIKTWVNHCSNAISNLPTDVCMHDEQELRDELEALDRKMNEMRPTIHAFEAMKSRILMMNYHDISLGQQNETIKESVYKRETDILEAWSKLDEQLMDVRRLINHSKRDVEIARKIKSILTSIGDLKDRLQTITVCKGDTILDCPLASIPTDHHLATIKCELMTVQGDVTNRLEPSIEELDQMLVSKNSVISQRAEITAAVKSLHDLLKTKQNEVSGAEKMQEFLTVTEELEVLLLALAEVVSRTSPQPHSSRADLQAMLIDLDTRYRYYEPKINDLMEELKEVSRPLLDDTRVTHCLCQFYKRWAKLQIDTESKKTELMNLIDPLGQTAFDVSLLERGRRAIDLAKRVTMQRSPTPNMMQSTPRYMAGRQTPLTFATAARATIKRTVGGTVSPTARKVVSRQVAVQQQQQQQQRRRSPTKPHEAYIADPKNDLDVAVGDILNDSPYKIQVKMVPGEVGKYWFGDVNPKLAYCRILRSRMVMVRVGGGWVELSEFLRDHALLEGNFVKGTTATTKVTQDSSYLATIGVTSKNSYRNHEQDPILRESKSTPHHPPGTYGIKKGNKFLVTVDRNGNQVEVKMTKAKSKNNKFITPRHINI